MRFNPKIGLVTLTNILSLYLSYVSSPQKSEPGANCSAVCFIWRWCSGRTWHRSTREKVDKTSVLLLVLARRDILHDCSIAAISFHSCTRVRSVMIKPKLLPRRIDFSFWYFLLGERTNAKGYHIIVSPTSPDDHFAKPVGKSQKKKKKTPEVKTCPRPYQK